MARLGIALLGLVVAVQAADGGKAAPQTKTGVVQKVDVAAKQIVVMVTRELTFTVTDSTKIFLGDAGKKQLADIKVSAKVTVDYTREGDARIAQKITILADK